MNKLSTLLTATAAVAFLAMSGFAQAADSENKMAAPPPQTRIAKTTVYSCCDARGVCLPANKDSTCPNGYTKTSVTTCEKGERGCNL